MLHRLARVYDWAYDPLTERRRARGVPQGDAAARQDAWMSGEVREGVGHLNQPYSSHGNRTWHKLAENAIATLGETPESDLFLDYAVTKFYAAYPVWSDDDGGWHEGLSYFAGYMSKAAWWMHLARTGARHRRLQEAVLRALRRLRAVFRAARIAGTGLRRSGVRARPGGLGAS